ncbi:MAG TPA: hypothetical protein VNJ01_13685 [Bacteriovoracaceae bacterium]|nr:hypothetical protein [Bacteriovoracaceae bacterium]
MAATVKDIIGIARTKKYRAKNSYAFNVSSSGFHGVVENSKTQLPRKRKKNWKLALTLSKPMKDWDF